MTMNDHPTALGPDAVAAAVVHAMTAPDRRGTIYLTRLPATARSYVVLRVHILCAGASWLVVEEADPSLKPTQFEIVPPSDSNSQAALAVARLTAHLYERMSGIDRLGGPPLAIATLAPPLNRRKI